MGKHLLHSRTPLTDQEVNPVAIRYTFAKRVALAEDVAAGYSYRDVCRRHNVALAAVHAAVHSQAVKEVIDPKIVEIRRRTMANALEYHADVALTTLDPAKWEKASALQHLIGAGIAIDKALVLRGQANQIVSVQSATESILADLERMKKDRLALSQSASLDAEIVDNKQTNHATNVTNADNNTASST